MSEIHSLTLRIRDLGQSIDWWNAAMIWALGLAAVAAVFVVIATRIIVTRTGQLSEAQTFLVAAKDRQLSIDLRDRDERIAEANRRTAELQAASLPRNFDVHALAKKLRQFGGTPVSVESLAEFEPARTLNLILSALVEAKWRNAGSSMYSGIPPDSLSRPGVSIQVAHMPKTENGPHPGEIIAHSEAELSARFAKLSTAAKALADVLNDSGIRAKMRPRSASGSQDDAVHVFVSLKPFAGMPEDLRVSSETH